MRVDWSAISPERRRLILVASDDTYAALTSALDARKLGKEALWLLVPHAGLLRAAFGAATASAEYLSALKEMVAEKRRADQESPLKRVFRLAKRAGEQVKQYFAIGDVPIPHLPQEEATTRFNFDIGHPLDGCAYLLNPCVENHYLQPAQANERLSQEKLAAFIGINADLGAKRLEVLSASMETNAKRAKVGLREVAMQVGLGGYIGTDGSVTRQVYMEFDPPEKKGFVADHHKMWLKTDPLLRALVHTRLAARVRTTQAALRFSEAIDVRADACAEIAGRGINVGGEYQSVHASTWNFAVEFWPEGH